MRKAKLPTLWSQLLDCLTFFENPHLMDCACMPHGAVFYIQIHQIWGWCSWKDFGIFGLIFWKHLSYRTRFANLRCGLRNKQASSRHVGQWPRNYLCDFQRLLFGTNWLSAICFWLRRSSHRLEVSGVSCRAQFPSMWTDLFKTFSLKWIV